MHKKADSELDLVNYAASGDALAFSILYQRYRERVYAFAYRMVRKQAIAEDVTQEAFLVLIEHPERYQAEFSSLLTFLCAIARNQIMYYLRQTGREIEIEEAMYGTLDQSTEIKTDPLSDLLDDELAGEVSAAIDALPPLQREVIVLREFQELSYQEIATVTGVDINLVKVRLHRARQSLARRLSPYLIPGDHCYEMR